MAKKSTGRVTLFITFIILSSGFIKEAGFTRSGTLPKGVHHGERAKIGGMECVFLRGGYFSMGSPGDRGYFNERPRHRVKVNPFWIGRYEVTQIQYRGIMGSNPSYFRGLTRPVEQVSWQMAVDFCKKFSSLYGVTARLPSEAEWEYAARAGTSTDYSWGNRIDGAYCWYNVNSGDSSHPVGLKKPNSWGLYDMSGNVFEWCMDYYSDGFYGDSPGDNPRGPGTGYSRVARGGSWQNNRFNLRSSFRVPFRPERGHFVNGFRIVIEPK